MTSLRYLVVTNWELIEELMMGNCELSHKNQDSNWRLRNVTSIEKN